MKLEMNRAWNQAISLIGANKDVVGVVAGVFFFLPYFAFTLAIPPLAPVENVQATEIIVRQMGEFYGDFWWVMILLSLIQSIGMLGLMALLTDHRRPTVGEALRIGASKVLSYIGAYLLAGIALASGIMAALFLASFAGATAAVLVMLVAVVLMVYVFIKLSLLPAVLVKEDIANPVIALRRSWQLTKGNSVRLFAFYFLLILTLLVLVSVLSLVTGLIFGLLGGEALRIGGAAVNSAMNAAWATLFLAVISAVHDQLGGTSKSQITDTFA